MRWTAGVLLSLLALAVAAPVAAAQGDRHQLFRVDLPAQVSPSPTPPATPTPKPTPQKGSPSVFVAIILVVVVLGGGVLMTVRNRWR